MLYDLTPEAESARTVYEGVFEAPYLESSGNYYKVKSAEYLANSTAADYLKKVLSVVDYPVGRRNCARAFDLGRLFLLLSFACV